MNNDGTYIKWNFYIYGCTTQYWRIYTCFFLLLWFFYFTSRCLYMQLYKVLLGPTLERILRFADRGIHYCRLRMVLPKKIGNWRMLCLCVSFLTCLNFNLPKILRKWLNLNCWKVSWAILLSFEFHPELKLEIIYRVSSLGRRVWSFIKQFLDCRFFW